MYSTWGFRFTFSIACSVVRPWTLRCSTRMNEKSWRGLAFKLARTAARSELRALDLNLTRTSPGTCFGFAAWAVEGRMRASAARSVTMVRERGVFMPGLR
jgi:hypothetical protein